MRSGTMQPRWSEAELMLAEVLVSQTPVTLLEQAWERYKEPHWPKRTCDSIRTKVNRLGLSYLPDCDYLSCVQVARLLNRKSNTVTKWVRAGRLPAKKISKNRWGVRIRDLLDYVRSNPNCTTPDRAEEVYLLYREAENFYCEEQRRKRSRAAVRA